MFYFVKVSFENHLQQQCIQQCTVVHIYFCITHKCSRCTGFGMWILIKQLTICPAAICAMICDIMWLMASALLTGGLELVLSSTAELIGENVASDGGTDRYGKLKLTTNTKHSRKKTQNLKIWWQWQNYSSQVCLLKLGLPPHAHRKTGRCKARRAAA